MKQETANKFAAILAAAQQKANSAAPIVKQELPQIAPPANVPANIAKMVSFTILWHEGHQQPDYTNVSFKTWAETQNAFFNLWDVNERGQDGGYTKVKVCIKWENGHEIIDRVDVTDKINNGDFNPSKEQIGAYLKKQGGFENLSFEDTPEPNKTDTFIELSTMTIDDLLNDSTPLYCSAVPFELPAVKKAEPEKPKLQLIDYSDRAFAIIGDTKPLKDLLFSLGGSFNRFLKCGEGWIFSKRHLLTVKQHLAL